MMHNRTLHSLLIVSFIAVFASVSLAADQVLVQNKPGLKRCITEAANVTAVVDAGGGAVSAVEVVLDVTKLSGECGNLVIDSVHWMLGTEVLPDRVVNLTAYPLIRFAAMSTGPQEQNLGVGSTVIASLYFKTPDCCAASYELDGAIWPSQPPLGVIQTQFVDADDSGIRPAAVTPGTVDIANALPVMAEIAGPFTLHWGETFSRTLAATDGDVGNGCETLTFFKQSGPDSMKIVGNQLTWATLGQDICYSGDIVIGVRDLCNAQDVAEKFNICVQNTAPEFTDVAPAANILYWGDTYTFDFNAEDGDSGPYGPFYHVISGPGTIDANGVYEWNTSLTTPPFGGDFEVVVKVDDGAPVCDPCSPGNSDEYVFHIKVYIVDQIAIQKVEDVYLGQETTVLIYASDHVYFPEPVGGFDFLIAYDASVMMFKQAFPGDLIVNDGPGPGTDWEYFTYRFGVNGNCGGGACPSGILRVVAMGETTGGNIAEHPDDTYLVPGAQLVELKFLVSSDANLECQFAAIRFVWYDCGDNTISNKKGDTLYIEKAVLDFIGNDEFGNPLFDTIPAAIDLEFPTFAGAPPECDELEWKGHPVPLIYFRNGGLDIICADSIDAVGDINLNKIPYEIADAVMFTNYFIVGFDAFPHPQGSTAASDTNKDGLTLTVADLVYLIRVIVGDALPYDKVGAVAMNWTHEAGVVATEGQVGGAALVVDGDVTPQLLVSGMTMESKFDGQVTRIVVVPDANAGTMNSFNGAFLGGIDRDIISIEMATPEGQPIAAKNIPTAYELSQNYPNPFNPSTKVNVSMKEAGDYSLTIYNVQGQVVQVISGSVSGPEYLQITWDASTLASGVYFYKFTAGNFTETKKAVLLK